MKAIGMDEVEIDTKTAEPYETQFWNNFDGIYGLSEIGMKQELPFFITDPSNRMKVEAIMEGRTTEVLGAEETHRLEA